jgi:hypothetical protein
MITPPVQESAEKFREPDHLLFVLFSILDASQLGTITTFILFDGAHLTKNNNETTNSEPAFDQ